MISKKYTTNITGINMFIPDIATKKRSKPPQPQLAVTALCDDTAF